MLLILTFGPLSGAHFNPAVSVAFALRREMMWRDAGYYIAAQIIGGVVGVWAAHLMFELPVWQFSLHVRSGAGQWLAEFIATFGLLLTILACAARNATATPYAVGLYITAAYWFTASTSFANAAGTIARTLSDTFAGVAPGGVIAFIAAQFACLLVGFGDRQRPQAHDRSAGSSRCYSGAWHHTTLCVGLTPRRLCA